MNNLLHDEKGKKLSEIGMSLNVFQKPSFSVVDSAFPCLEIMKS